MPTEKRRRQDEGRMTRQEAARAEAKRRQRMKGGRNLAIILGLLLLAAFAVSVLSGDDDDGDTATGDSSSTTADGSGTTAPGSEAFAYGTTPCPVEGAEPKKSFDAAFEQCIDPAKTYTATFETTVGNVVVALDTAHTPGTVNSFVSLTRSGYYDGTKLFRTDPSIGIIQGGAPTTNSASDPGPGFTIPDEGGPYTYVPGQLVMARTQAEDSAGAQFFFSADAAVSALDGQGTYVVFGTVSEGLDVLEQILASHQAQPDNPLGGAPNPEVTVTKITITEA